LSEIILTPCISKELSSKRKNEGYSFLIFAVFLLIKEYFVVVTYLYFASPDLGGNNFPVVLTVVSSFLKVILPSVSNSTFSLS